jgi:iron complex transport system permease protein
VVSGLAVVLVWTIVVSVGIGAVAIPPGQVVGVLLDALGFDVAVSHTDAQEAILLNIRIPRVVLAILVGAALSVSGAAMQGLFRNPLADPGLIGISNGAAFATAVALVLTGPLAMTEWFRGAVMPMAAFVGGVVSTLVVYRLSTTDGRTHVATMLLAGIAVNALTGAGIGYLVFLADDNQIRDLTFWLLGSLGGAQWSTVLTVAPFLLAAVFWLPGLARGLNAMLLGESEATHLGFRVERLKKVIILLVGLSVGAAVSVSGVIGFVGLVVPHILRLWIGPDHRFLLPGSALLGALLLLGSDLAARTLAAPAEIPIGVITASVGAPFFLWLLMTDKMRGEG